MNVLIVYDSLFGNTEKIALAIKDGFKGHNVNISRSENVSMSTLKDIDILVVGSPTHGGRPYLNTQEFLKNIDSNILKSKYGIAFDTGIPSEGQSAVTKFAVRMFGYAANRIASKMEEKGLKVIGKDTFFVLGKEGPLKTGEELRATKWIIKLLNELN